MVYFFSSSPLVVYRIGLSLLVSGTGAKKLQLYDVADGLSQPPVPDLHSSCCPVLKHHFDITISALLLPALAARLEIQSLASASPKGAPSHIHHSLIPATLLDRTRILKFSGLTNQ